MGALSFRIKLLLAMMLIVAGVTGATLIATQKRVKAAYQDLFQEQFETLINYFADKQEARLSTAKDKCSELARTVRFTAFFLTNENPDPEDIADLYKTAQDELREVRQKEIRKQRPQPAKPLPALPLRRNGKPAVATQAAAAMQEKLLGGEAVFLRFLNAKGQVLQTKEPRVLKPANRARVDQQLSAISQGLSNVKEQETGYLSTEEDKLLEVVVTPIIDAASGQTLAALVIGVPVGDMGGDDLKKMSQIRSGIFLGNQIHSQTIPKEIQADLSRCLQEEIKLHAEPRDDFVFSMAGKPYQVFYKPLNPDSPFPIAHHVGLYSLEKVRAGESGLRLSILSFSALALLGALAVSLLLSHGLAAPLRELVAATLEIKKGNFTVKLPVRSRVDFGQLAHSFNEMTADLALKEKYHNVLNMVADKDVAQRLMSGDVALGGEVREISVLFCDIRGFTALTQNMPPAEVIQMLNEHMTALTRVVYEHHGVVDKFVGDLIMAVFGAPKSYGNDAFNAARCAVRMIEERQKLNQTSHHKIEMGIGIATGQAIAGCMGSSDRLNYTVLGERVNLASRLCGQAGRMQVVIGETTREKLGDLIEAEPLPDLLLKGFAEAVKAYKLTAVHSQPTSS